MVAYYEVWKIAGVLNTMNELGLEYVNNMDDYDMLCTQIYEHYGIARIFEPRTQTDFDFPEPLVMTSTGRAALAPTESPGKEQFFKYMLHPDARALLPFVDAALATERAGSPIFTASADLAIDRESLAQIVDRAYRLAGASGVARPQDRALLNMLVLIELLVWR